MDSWQNRNEMKKDGSKCIKMFKLCSSMFIYVPVSAKKKQEMSRTKDLLKDHIPIVTLRRVKDLAVRSGLQELGGQD
jgi:hypothetical protein